MKTVIEMAREAGLLTIGTADGGEAVYTWPKGITEEIERFAELVRADEREHGQRWFDAVTAQHKQAILAEREACAKVCADADKSTHPADLADAIRARSKT